MNIQIQENKSLKEYNTFNIDVQAKYLSIFKNEDELHTLLKNDITKNKEFLVLGGGSNILFTKDFQGTVLINRVKGIKIVKEDKKNVFLSVGAGENWHNFVSWSIKKGFYGIENLALIPGLIGASPMQNIGAYGVEIKDFITEVRYISVATSELITLNNKKCEFNYRDSIFKNKLKNKTIITNVTYMLNKIPNNNISYGDIEKEIRNMGKIISPLSIKEAVINIRNKKIPDPRILPNSGSFFKNPIISTVFFNNLKKRFPNIVGYQTSKKETKVAAGWLIENDGWKGYREGDVGVHKNQALVLINHGNASGLEILELSKRIQSSIKNKYGIELQPEVNIY